MLLKKPARCGRRGPGLVTLLLVPPQVPRVQEIPASAAVALSLAPGACDVAACRGPCAAKVRALRPAPRAGA